MYIKFLYIVAEDKRSVFFSHIYIKGMPTIIVRRHSRRRVIHPIMEC